MFAEQYADVLINWYLYTCMYLCMSCFCRHKKTVNIYVYPNILDIICISIYLMYICILIFKYCIDMYTCVRYWSQATFRFKLLLEGTMDHSRSTVKILLWSFTTMHIIYVSIWYNAALDWELRSQGYHICLERGSDLEPPGVFKANGSIGMSNTQRVSYAWPTLLRRTAAGTLDRTFP